ncbi:MAG: hypothetical protein WC821_01655 [archaeon]|jgi:hypothetical protein
MVNPQVELVPWVHDLSFEAHAEVVDYIKQLPKNSVLCVEANQKDFGLPPTNALIEIIHECGKLNIKLVPIESFPLITRHRKVSSNSHYGETTHLDEYYSAKESKLCSQREKAFVRNIKSILYTLKKPKLVVLVGAGHIKGLVRELANEKISSKINLAPFKERDLIIKIIRTGHSSAKEVSTKLSKEANQARLEREKLLNIASRRDRFDAAIVLQNKVNQRESIAKKRIKLKKTRLRR